MSITSLKELPNGNLIPIQLPEIVKEVSPSGVFILNEELVENGRIKKITGKLPPSPYSNVDWTEEEILALPDFIWYESNVDGGYIGTENDYKYLVEQKRLILIQKAEKDDNTCSIGYSVEENKWYGWSHRALYGFGIGDVVKEGDLTNTSGFVEEYRIQHPDEDMSLPVGFKAQTLNDAKRMAIAFAKAVS